jgi:hypothetical protein
VTYREGRPAEEKRKDQNHKRRQWAGAYTFHICNWQLKTREGKNNSYERINKQKFCLYAGTKGDNCSEVMRINGNPRTNQKR